MLNRGPELGLPHKKVPVAQLSICSPCETDWTSAILGFVFVPDSSAAAHWRVLFPYSHHCFIPTASPYAKRML